MIGDQPNPNPHIVATDRPVTVNNVFHAFPKGPELIVTGCYLGFGLVMGAAFSITFSMAVAKIAHTVAAWLP